MGSHYGLLCAHHRAMPWRLAPPRVAVRYMIRTCYRARGCGKATWGLTHPEGTFLHANVEAYVCRREADFMQTWRLTHPEGRLTSCKRESYVCKRDRLLVHTRAIPSANATPSFCKREGFFVKARRLPSACATASFCKREACLSMREGFLLQTRELLSGYARVSLCKREGLFVHARDLFLHAKTPACESERVS